MTRRISIVLFDGFELLDVCGPVELLSHVEGITLDFVGPEAGLVSSAQGLRVECGRSFRELSKEPIDILLVPGGPGTRTLVDDAPFLAWLTEAGARARLLASVCTGSALLASAGLLEGSRATSNTRPPPIAIRIPSPPRPLCPEGVHSGAAGPHNWRRRCQRETQFSTSTRGTRSGGSSLAAGRSEASRTAALFSRRARAL